MMHHPDLCKLPATQVWLGSKWQKNCLRYLANKPSLARVRASAQIQHRPTQTVPVIIPQADNPQDNLPSFKKALMNRRCLIPADGFYEWKTAAGSKIPMNIHLKSNELFAMAGLWEQWISPDGKCCALA